MIVTENKITDHVYCQNSMRYDVVFSKAITTADINVQGGSGQNHPGPTSGMEHRFDAL